jgi:hypothetical protein
MRRFDTTLNLDDADLDDSEVQEVLAWVYQYDETRTTTTSPLLNSMMCAWNSMMLPEDLTIGVLGVHRNVPREQSVAFLTNAAKEMFSRFGTDSMQPRVKSLQWAMRIYSHKLEGCESLRDAVITGLRPFLNDMVEMEAGKMLMISNEEFKHDVLGDVGSDNTPDEGLGCLNEEAAKLTMQESVKAKEKMDNDQTKESGVCALNTAHWLHHSR